MIRHALLSTESPVHPDDQQRQCGLNLLDSVFCENFLVQQLLPHQINALPGHLHRPDLMRTDAFEIRAEPENSLFSYRCGATVFYLPGILKLPFDQR